MKKLYECTSTKYVNVGGLAIPAWSVLCLDQGRKEATLVLSVAFTATGKEMDYTTVGKMDFDKVSFKIGTPFTNSMATDTIRKTYHRTVIYNCVPFKAMFPFHLLTFCYAHRDCDAEAFLKDLAEMQVTMHQSFDNRDQKPKKKGKKA